MNVPLPWLVAWRFLRGRRSRLLDGTARAALLSTALGVTAMVVAMALMTGYRFDLQGKLVRGNAAVVAYPASPHESELAPDAVKQILAIPGVRRVGRVVYGQGSLASEQVAQGVDITLRGVDPGGGQLSASAAQLRTGPDGLPGAVLGADLAAKIKVKKGDVLRLVALGFVDGVPRFRYRSLRVAGTFDTGFAEFDRSWVLLERGAVEALVGGGQAVDLVELTLADPAQAPRVADSVASILGDHYVVTDWQQLNRELFAALRLQQIVLFLVLGLIVLVSTFNVASTLVVLVRERMRDIGLLGALGLRAGKLRLVFHTYGGFLGITGTLIGVAAGWAICWTLTTFELIRFEPEVAAIYFIKSVPFRIRPLDLAAIIGFSLLVNLVACAFPAWLAVRLDPSSALRYE
jgi:lipoprotein-releasing system permease protein